MTRSAMPRHASAARAAGILLITAATLSPAGVEAAAGGVPPPGADGQRAPADAIGALASKRPRRALDQAVLALSPPQLAAPLLSGVPATMQPVARYRGTGSVAYELIEGPDGMTLGTASGLLFWTPPASAEGTAPTTRVRASDGQATAETTFPVPVVACTPVEATLAGPTLTVTEGSLQGVAWTFPTGTSRPLGELAVSTVTADRRHRSRQT